MGTTGVTIKLMPTSPEVNLEELKQKVSEELEKQNAKNPRFQEEPIAFGLKALITMFEIEEDQELDPIENGLEKIENISSSQIIDMRKTS